MSLAQFNNSSTPPVIKTPAEELRSSKDKLMTVRRLLSPERVDETFPARPALVWNIRKDSGSDIRYYKLLPVTTLGGKSLFEANLTFRQQRILIPIFPNSHDTLVREPLRTRPCWKNDNSYQVLRGVQVTSRTMQSIRRTVRLSSGELERLEGLVEVVVLRSN
jgi:hypothetical protein